MQNAVTIPVAEHRHHIEADLEAALRVPGEKNPGCPNQPVLLRPGHHAVPIGLHGLGPGLDLDDDEPGTIPGNEVHLQPPNPPIPGKHLPTPADDMFEGHLLAPSAEALSLRFHEPNIAAFPRPPCYFCRRMCLRRPAVRSRHLALTTAWLLLATNAMHAQPGSRAIERAIGYVAAPKGDAKWYVHWGYHRAEYGRTDLRLIAPGVDLTFHGLKATDMPAPFDPAVHLNPLAFTIPQFNARVGRRIRGRDLLPGATWISLGWDHLKYKVPHAVHEVSGVIDSLSFDHTPFDWTWRDFNFEHSDGMNFIRVAVERDLEFGRAGRTRQTWDTANRKWRFGLQGAASLGLVLCATDVRWQGVRTKHYWHISGWGASASAGAWVQFGRFRALMRAQGGWIDITNSRFLASSDLSGETPVVEGIEGALLDASEARHAMTFLEKGVTVAYLFGRKGRPAADERVRTTPGR